MSPPERSPANDPHEWLKRARSNLVRARQREAGVYLEDLCFDAQQAAEKAVKAVLVARRIDFPYLHDLTHLVSLLKGAGEVLPEAIRNAGRLTPYAVLTRYPGTVRPVTERDYERAVKIAEAVVGWAGEQL